MVLTLHPEVPVAPGGASIQEATQQVAEAFTAAITAAPQDWHMMQPVFLDDLSPADASTVDPPASGGEDR